MELRYHSAENDPSSRPSAWTYFSVLVVGIFTAAAAVIQFFATKGLLSRNPNLSTVNLLANLMAWVVILRFVAMPLQVLMGLIGAAWMSGFAGGRRLKRLAGAFYCAANLACLWKSFRTFL